MMAQAPAPPPPEPKHTEEEPPSKKQKTEDQLISEDEFLRRFKVGTSSSPILSPDEMWEDGPCKGTGNIHLNR